MKCSCITWLVVIAFSFLETISGQDFQNLGFESQPIIVGADLGIGSRYVIPDWTVSFNNTPQQSGVWIGAYILDYTTAALFVSPSASVIAGTQSVFLAASSFEAPIGGFSTENISQIGIVPSTANSIQFKLGTILGFGGTVDTSQPQNNFYVTLNNQIVPLQITANTGSYLILAGDVSMWAGQAAELAIGVGVPYNGNSSPEILYSGVVDDVSFSPSPVPEPSVSMLSITSLLLLPWFARRRNNSPELRPIRAVSPYSRLTDRGRGSGFVFRL
jgi:hypothetical protein